MIKYTPSNQLTLKEFKHPFHQQLRSDNRWVLLAELVPWDELAGIYAKNLDPKAGRLSVDIRMVIGALIIKHKLSLSDRDQAIGETDESSIQVCLFFGLFPQGIYQTDYLVSGCPPLQTGLDSEYGAK